MPAKSHLRTAEDDRPRSSGGLVETYQNDAFTALDDFQQRRPRHNTLHLTPEKDETSVDHGRGTTPTPSRYASRGTSYLSGPPPASLYEQSPHDWSNSPDTFHFGGRRGP